MEAPGSTATLTYSRRLSVESIDRFCVVPGECVNTEPLIPLLVFVMTGLFALLLAATIAHLRNAQTTLDEERARTRAERDAFAEFERRVAAIDATPAEATVPGSGGVTPLSVSSTGGGLEQVKDVYRDTVMAISHYEEEYDERLETNMAAELSEEAAAAVDEGGSLTPHLKGALVEQSRRARAQRDEFLAQLDREAEELADAQRTVVDIETALSRLNEAPINQRSFPELMDAWERLGELEEDCRDLLDTRQRTIQRQRAEMSRTGPTIQDYLYESLAVTYPVLAAGTNLVENVRTARSRVVSAVTRRV